MQFLSSMALACATFSLCAKEMAPSPMAKAPKKDACAAWVENNLQQFTAKFSEKPELYPDEGVIKFTFIRPDVQIRIHNQSLDPFMSSNTWIAFQKGLKPGVEVMMMGHFALHEDEVNPAIAAAIAAKIDITSLHHHFFSQSEPTYFIHVNFEGSTNNSIKGVQNIFSAIKQAHKRTPKPTLPAKSMISAEPLEKILAASGRSQEGMLRIEIGRKIQAGCGCPIGKGMGVKTWVAFSGTNERALVNGDVVATEKELQPVLRELIKSTKITAIHNHMIGECPRLIFVHFTAEGNAAQIAKTVKSALDKTTTYSSTPEDAGCSKCQRSVE